MQCWNKSAMMWCNFSKYNLTKETIFLRICDKLENASCVCINADFADPGDLASLQRIWSEKALNRDKIV